MIFYISIAANILNIYCKCYLLTNNVIKKFNFNLIIYMKGIFLILILISGVLKAHEVNNDYFFSITKEIYFSRTDINVIKKIRRRETEKYIKTGDVGYLISREYAEFFLHLDKPIDQLPIIYELLKLNNDRYEFISVSCNFSLALQLENNSPILAREYLDKAINLSEKLPKKYLLSHMYHAKGRFYYNNKNYKDANLYFKKALNNFGNNDQLYKASMYNNFALISDKTFKTASAIEYTLRGIDILLKKSRLTHEDLLFYNKMRCNLGLYYKKAGKVNDAEHNLVEVLNNYKRLKSPYTEILVATGRLFDLYYDSKQNIKLNEIIAYLKEIEPNLSDTQDLLTVSEFLQKQNLAENNIREIKKTSEKLLILNEKFDQENLEKQKMITDALNKVIIKNIDNKYTQQLSNEKFKQYTLITATLLILAVFFMIIKNIRDKAAKEKEIRLAEKLLFDNKRRILEQDMQIQRNKIKDLHQNLSLKIETEKAFLEHLKKVKRLRNKDAEEVIKDLMFRVNNLMQIDSRNYDLLNESSQENKIFKDHLAKKFPILTNKELQLCIYFRMQLSSKEISILENTTDGTIRVYKTKIKNKLLANREEDLTSYLNTLEVDSFYNIDKD